jgi:hypothetical protein
MANRIVLLVSVMVAGIALTVASANAAPTADQCLAKPSSAPPSGKHWYYRLSRPTQRKCWYLGDAGAPVTPPKQSAARAPDDPLAGIGAQPPAANARAELIDEPRRAQPGPPIMQRQADAPLGAAAGADKRGWAVASRWPDPSEAFPPSRAPIADDPARVSRTESPPRRSAANPVAPAEQPLRLVDNSDDNNLAQSAADLVLAVIVGGALVLLLASVWRVRRASSGRERGAMLRRQARAT